ncbi:hypothetical protein KAI04_01250 [Candidatus Pacearchaeota archaeon]|nr:hypothetical protein [Candidatus Pacearchaeota archaeon]
MKNLRISIIGPGNIKYHYQDLLRIKEKTLKKHINNLGKVIAESNNSIAIVPDKGICLEIAKSYKKQGGKQVLAIVPKDDKKYGTKHLKQYIFEKNLFDKTINSKTWQEQLFNLCLYGDVCLYLGSSIGSNAELLASVYRYNKLNKFKKNKKKFDKEIKAGSEIHLTFIIYTPFLKSKRLPTETEAYFKKFKIKLEYVKSPKQLKEKLQKL